MQTNFSLLIFLRFGKNNHTNQASVMVRITTSGQRAEFSTGRKCEKALWDPKAAKMSGNKAEAKAFNMYLDTIKARIYEIHRQMILNEDLITAESIKNKYLGKNEKPRLIMEIFADHNKRMEALIGQEFSAGTFERYKTSYKHTLDFLEWKYSTTDFDIRNINHAFITDYDFYLRTVRRCANNTTIKYIRNFQKVVRICLKNGWLAKDPFVNYSVKLKEVTRTFLTEEEIEAIQKKKFVSGRLDQVRDIFLFSCFTGLAYADVKELKKSDIQKVISAEKWIMTKRKKTDTVCNIPVLPPVEELIQKYKDDPRCENADCLLPVISNQKMNSYLKEIADVCGIQKELTFHIARHTFATTVTLTNGVSIESVSKMLGHTNLKTTQHYAKILDKKIGDDMRSLHEKYTKVTSVEKEVG
ncbi:site-specific integrase [Fluviicola taffensis]|uniref:Integrase family protein n=1 Tax=Fluviicola taffensis (strain DSM 16823 / NCIMB 13979 / RW262) TaxID=755732 RepID=F2IGR3_FLUTR|nr:site-specific integrase [Fluviicola taffensis]AEA43680.1 integrase family protein [Fluviicola taffensis DSM 16823]